MDKAKAKKIAQFLVFIFPSYFIIGFIFYCLFQGAIIWQEPAMIPFTLIIIGTVFAGFSLVKRQYWASIFMVAVGGFIIYNSTDHPFIFEVLQIYGAYLIAHFSLASLYVFLKAKKEKKS